MGKIGILTFHYSNNYGGVLQALSLQKAIELMGFEVEIINFVPSYYNTSIKNSLGISKKTLFVKKNFNLINLCKKYFIARKYNHRITQKFNEFRMKEMRLSKQVDENSILTILNNYDLIIAGSDQIWNPSQRKNREYFLDFGSYYTGKKVSYAADSTIKEVNKEDIEKLRRNLLDFDYISVRNEYSSDFVYNIIGRKVDIVTDPTINYNYQPNIDCIDNEDYILVYTLGKEIEGSNLVALKKVKDVYGNLPIYSIIIPTINFELPNYADKIFYDLDPNEWLIMIKKAKFFYTDSFHGVLYALKYNIPFLAYYTEKMRSTRFIDLSKRYNIEKYIVQNTEEIDLKNSIKSKPDFESINNLLNIHKQYSLAKFEEILKNLLGKN